jgi:predicted dehydrogenase
MRKQLHYEWHWFWATGNGEMGNNGIHVIDLCRWALGQNQPPPRAMSIGGRFAFDDGGQTANTQIALLDYHPPRSSARFAT